MKKRIISLCMVVCLLAVAIVGGTMAYFTDTDTDTNVMTMGKVSIEQKEWMRTEDLSGLKEYEAQPLIPAVIYSDLQTGTLATSWGASAYKEDTTHKYTVEGLDDNFQMPSKDYMKNVVDKIVTVTNTGNEAVYVRTILLIEDAEKNVMPNLEMMYDSNVSFKMVGYVTISNIQYYVIEFIYTDAVAPEETTLPSAMAFWMNPSATAASVPADFDIIAYSQAVQADGFTSAEKALDTAFGDVTTANTAWYVTE